MVLIIGGLLQENVAIYRSVPTPHSAPGRAPGLFGHRKCQLPTQNISAESNPSAYLNAFQAKKRDQRPLPRVVVATEDVFFGLEAQNSDPHKGCLAFSLGTQTGIDVKC